MSIVPRGLSIVILLCAALTACAERKPVLFVTIPPQRWLIEQLAGDNVEVRLLVQPGQNPHTFEPRGKQLAALAQAQGWLTIGLPFERTILAKARSLAPELTEYPIYIGVQRLTSDQHQHHGEDEVCSDDGADPHIWLSPQKMAQLGTNSFRALQHVLPTRQAELELALVRLTETLSRLQTSISATLAPVKGGTFWVYHPSWAYFAQSFGLKQHAVEDGGREPSAKQLANLIATAKALHARVLFADPQFDPRPIRSLANQIGAKVVVLNPLDEAWDLNLQRVAAEILAALHE